MGQILAFVMVSTLSFFSSSALAASYNVECMANNCLQNGWVANDARGFVVFEALCSGGDCARNGWEHIPARGSESFVRCQDGGCFSKGWTESNKRGEVYATAVCQRGSGGHHQGEADCLRHGWKTFQRDGSHYQVKCLGGNCETVGWETQFNGRSVSRVLCKAGGCFTNGWTIHQ